MQLQEFLFKKVKQRGPLGLFDEVRCFPTGTAGMTVDGKKLEADENGWVDVPHRAAMEYKARIFHREDGGYTKFCTPDEVDQTLRLGLADAGSIKLPVAPPKAEEVSAEPAPKRKVAPVAAKAAASKAQADGEATEKSHIEEQTARAEAWEALGIDESEWSRDDEGNLLEAPVATTV